MKEIKAKMPSTDPHRTLNTVLTLERVFLSHQKQRAWC